MPSTPPPALRSEWPNLQRAVAAVDRERGGGSRREPTRRQRSHEAESEEQLKKLAQSAKEAAETITLIAEAKAELLSLKREKLAGVEKLAEVDTEKQRVTKELADLKNTMVNSGKVGEAQWEAQVLKVKLEREKEDRDAEEEPQLSSETLDFLPQLAGLEADPSFRPGTPEFDEAVKRLEALPEYAILHENFAAAYDTMGPEAFDTMVKSGKASEVVQWEKVQLKRDKAALLRQREKLERKFGFLPRARVVAEQAAGKKAVAEKAAAEKAAATKVAATKAAATKAAEKKMKKTAANIFRFAEFQEAVAQKGGPDISLEHGGHIWASMLKREARDPAHALAMLQEIAGFEATQREFPGAYALSASERAYLGELKEVFKAAQT